jgi:hypothetical protein
MDGHGQVSREPHTFESEDDDAAITRAEQFVNGYDVELWEHHRVVALIDVNGVQRRSTGAPMSGSDTYRKLAEECRAQAARTTDAQCKRQCEDMARGWFALACRAEGRRIGD